MKDRLPGIVVKGISSAGIFIMIFILYFLFREGIPVLKAVTLRDLFFGDLWYPAENPPVLGMFPLIVGTLAVTAASSLLALPFSLLIAVFVSEVAPRPVRELLKPVLELLGFFPSIVLGFIGMVVLAPWLQETFDMLSGLNLLNASVLLGVLTVPIVSSLAEEALSAVPGDLREVSMQQEDVEPENARGDRGETGGEHGAELRPRHGLQVGQHGGGGFDADEDV